jgi:hypothetical protein
MGDGRNIDPVFHPRSAALLEPTKLWDVVDDDGHELDESYDNANERPGQDLSDEARDTLRRIVVPRKLNDWKV